MSKLNEKIAKMSNREDQCKGHFWEGSYKAQLILVETALLACAIYVDLNPIRAAMAKTPEGSKYTGAKDRVDDLAESKAISIDLSQDKPTSSKLNNECRQEKRLDESTRTQRNEQDLSPLSSNEDRSSVRIGPTPNKDSTHCPKQWSFRFPVRRRFGLPIVRFQNTHGANKA